MDFLKKSMMIELEKAGLEVKNQVPIKVYYEKQLVGEYFADIVVNDLVVLELKAVFELSEAHENQLYNYLKSTQYEVGLLFNFGERPQLKRKIYSNQKK